MNNEIEKIYIDNFEGIYRFCMFRLNNRQEAEDFTQEAFEKLIEVSKQQKILNPKAWLFRVARNAIYDRYAEKSRIADITEDQINSMEVVGTNLSETVISQELMEQVQGEIESLDGIEKEIIALKVFEEMKFKDIAELIEENINKVKFVYYQALEKIKVAVGEREQVKGTKLYSINLAGVILGIQALKSSKDLLPPAELVSNLFSLFFNKVFMESTMNAAEVTSTVAKAAEATVGAATADVAIATASGINAKLIGIVAAIAIVASGVTGGVVYTVTKDSDDQVEGTPTPTIEVTVEPTDTNDLKDDDNSIVSPTVTDTPETITENTKTVTISANDKSISIDVPESWEESKNCKLVWNDYGDECSFEDSNGTTIVSIGSSVEQFDYYCKNGNVEQSDIEVGNSGKYLIYCYVDGSVTNRATFVTINEFQFTVGITNEEMNTIKALKSIR